MVDKSLQLRKARKEDLSLYFDWVNDPVVRANAIDSSPIIPKKHEEWFKKKLESDSIMLILEHNGDPVGQIRLDPYPDHYLLDYSIDAKYRGMGLGTRIVQLGIDYLREVGSILPIKALVKKDNAPSNKVFVNLRFNFISTSSVEKPPLNEYRYFFGE